MALPPSTHLKPEESTGEEIENANEGCCFYYGSVLLLACYGYIGIS